MKPCEQSNRALIWSFAIAIYLPDDADGCPVVCRGPAAQAERQAYEARDEG